MLPSIGHPSDHRTKPSPEHRTAHRTHQTLRASDTSGGFVYPLVPCRCPLRSLVCKTWRPTHEPPGILTSRTPAHGNVPSRSRQAHLSRTKATAEPAPRPAWRPHRRHRASEPATAYCAMRPMREAKTALTWGADRTSRGVPPDSPRVRNTPPRSENPQSRGRLAKTGSSWPVRRRSRPKSRRSRKGKQTLSTTAKGYGWNHQQKRARWKPRVEAGGVPCGWCGNEIIPGTPWAMGHPNDDKRFEPSPWHRSCNARFAAMTKRRRQMRGGSSGSPLDG